MRLPAGMSRRTGFTMIEVVTVLMILGVVAAVVVPAYATLGPRDDLDRATADATRILTRARMSAMRHGAPVRVSFDTADRTVRVDLATADSTRRLTTDTLDASTETTITADGHPLHVRFDPLGGASGGPFIVVAAGRTATITIDRWTGEVDVRSR